MSRSHVGIDEFYREPSRRRQDVDVRIREPERDRLPSFLREERRPEQGPLVLRQREVETVERRRRSPSPVRVREARIITRARSVSPPQRMRSRSRAPDLERLRTRILERDRSSSPEPDRERVRTTTRIIDRAHSPSPTREHIRIIKREQESRRPSPSPSPPPQVIKGPVVEREVITHYTDVNHGMIDARPRSPPPQPRRRERDTEIDIYTSRNETEVDIHKHSSRNRGRSVSRPRSYSRERPSPHIQSYDEEVLVSADRRHLHVDIDARRSTSRVRRAHSAAPIFHDQDDEAREITERIDSRGRMGEAKQGITKDWTIVDVPPGTERVRMDGAGGASAEVTWQKYSGVRRSKFIPDRDERSTVVSSSTSLSDREYRDSPRESRLSVSIYDKQDRGDKEIDIVADRRMSIHRQTASPAPRRNEMWTEITKDLVIREAIEELGYEYEETEWFFYIMTYLRYEDVLQLVQLSDAVRRARKDRVHEIQWEREYRDEWDREYRHHHHSHSHGRHRPRFEEHIVESEVAYETGRPSRSYR
ncbi:hypothetical protein B0H67DRAFT_478186 [Lasiosphaeris hirsuta]|uniref:DUF8035 domain-containing protein n=1 Tax=Lasiosphaeris hirsuta TaxID=260670 RepID=A0AA40EAF0_9PEZI|nr:hypothetical protein B0H67DRAFT_478186 [Lasiosphaeris hirsuta]